MDHRQEAAYATLSRRLLGFHGFVRLDQYPGCRSDRQLQRLQFPSRQFDKTKSLGIQEAENEKCGNHGVSLTSKLDFSRGESEIEFTSEARATAWRVPTAKVGESATA
jgi:hypothetical protein